MAGSIKVHFLIFNLRLFACNALSGDLGCFCVGIMLSVRMSQMCIRMSQMCLSGCLTCVYQDVSHVSACFLLCCYPLGIVFSCQHTTTCFLSYCSPLGVFLLSGHCNMFPIILLSTGCFPVVRTLQHVSYHTAIHLVFSCCQDTTTCFLSYWYSLGVFLLSGHCNMFPIILLSTWCFPVVRTLQHVSYHTGIHWVFSCCQHTTTCFLSYWYSLGVFLLSAHYNMFHIMLVSTGCFPVVRTLQHVSYHAGIHWVFSCCQHTTTCFLSYCYPLGVFLLSAHYNMFHIILLSTGCFPVVRTLQQFPIILVFTGCFPVVRTLQHVSYHTAIHWVFSCCQDTTTCFLSYCYSLGVFLLSGHYNMFPIILLSTGCFPVVRKLQHVSYHTGIHWVFTCGR